MNHIVTFYTEAFLDMMNTQSYSLHDQLMDIID